MNNEFKIKFLNFNEDILADIGFDKSYMHKALNKHRFYTIKIFSLSCAQANILKQTAISCGTDCAVHRDVITGGIELSDCVLSATVSQFYKIADKLKFQPFKLSFLGKEILNIISYKLNPLIIRNKTFNWEEKTYIMGILNVTPDSFSDGGRFNNIDSAIEHYKNMVLNGADIIDIGGESTRPSSSPVAQDDEINRVIPVIKAIREFDNKTVISIDTRNALTARLALESGVDIVNDVSALSWDNNMLQVIKDFSCPVVINHSSDTPDKMQFNTDFSGVDNVFDYLKSKVDYLVSNGIKFENIIIDIGLGFGKTVEQNIQLINHITEFKTIGCPILVGHSRKSFIKNSLDLTSIDSLDKATLLISSKLSNSGVNILRVHDVESHKLMTSINNLFV